MNCSKHTSMIREKAACRKGWNISGCFERRIRVNNDRLVNFFLTIHTPLRGRRITVYYKGNIGEIGVGS